MRVLRFRLKYVIALALSSTLCLVLFSAYARTAQSPQSGGFRVLLLQKATISGHATYTSPPLTTSRIGSVTVSCDPLIFNSSPNMQLAVKVLDSAGEIGAKALHVGDPDLYTLFRPRRAGPLKVRIDVTGGVANTPGAVTVQVVEWLVDAGGIRNLAYKPNGDWKSANPMELGRTVFGSGDLTPYIPIKVDERTQYYDATKGKDGLTFTTRTDSVPDWLTFNYDGEAPKLVYFQLDLPERDNIPPDVSVFVEKDGQAVPYEVGADPVTAPHEVQSLPGNKFTTRVITKGKYYVRVLANHPEWQLRTQVLDPPPYHDPEKAVKAGIDYLLGAGDSWHANIPRSGSRLNRVSSVHAETAQCIACHPTQFSTRAVFTAMKYGYRPERIESLRFLTERMANNPRPFYGHPGATWVRMISAPGNVTSRVADLVAEGNTVFGEPLELATHLGAYNYLKLYYQGRSELPEDESNGNTPLVSQYEVVYYSWRVFDREHKRTDSAESKQLAGLTAKLLEQNRHKNLVDLCWHTIAMAEIDRKRFEDKIKANCERILSLQRADGQWSMQLDPKSAAVEFQTGHALYALAASGFRPDHTAVKRTVEFLLPRQQPFGGWFDPNQTYENFRTPFRETQFAVMALARLYPLGEPNPSTGQIGRIGQIQSNPCEILSGMDLIRGKQPADVLRRLEALLTSPEPLFRQQAAQALGRTGQLDSVGKLAPLLGDASKMVQRTAAVAIRNFIGIGGANRRFISAIASPSTRQRAGAVRVAAYHSRALSADSEALTALRKMTADAFMPNRIAALQALWQQFWWTEDSAVKGLVLDAILARLAANEHPWVTRNAREALYNVADENTRYLYNNWIPVLADSADRDKAAAAQRAQDLMIARKLAKALTAGNPRLRLNVLQGVSEFHLRNVRAQNTRYARIGNDVEQIRFSGEAGKELDAALVQCFKDPSPMVRRYAAIAAYTLRDNGPLPVATLLLGALIDPDSAVRAAAGEFYRSLPPDPTSKATESAVASLLSSKDPDARRAGIETALTSERLEKSASISDSLDSALSSAGGVKDALDLMKKSAPVRKTLRGASVISDALSSDNAGNRSAALDIVQKDEALRSAPAIQAALNELVRSGVDASESARKLLAKTDTQAVDTARQLDFPFFSRRVMPVFAKKSSADGLACISCHFNHNILKVTAPDSAGRFSESQIRETYRAALKVVNLQNPEESLILRKPTSSSASEGLIDARAVAHGGGMRWSGPEDADYQVMLAWIKGAKEDVTAGVGR